MKINKDMIFGFGKEPHNELLEHLVVEGLAHAVGDNLQALIDKTDWHEKKELEIIMTIEGTEIEEHCRGKKHLKNVEKTVEELKLF